MQDQGPSIGLVLLVDEVTEFSASLEEAAADRVLLVRHKGGLHSLGYPVLLHAQVQSAQLLVLQVPEGFLVHLQVVTLSLRQSVLVDAGEAGTHRLHLLVVHLQPFPPHVLPVFLFLFFLDLLQNKTVSSLAFAIFIWSFWQQQ